MALQSSGQISLNDVNVELGNSGTATINMNSSDVRDLFGVASGQIKMSDGYGKSSVAWYGDRGIFAGGNYPTENDISYISIGTTGNASSFGTLSQKRADAGSVSDGSRVVIAGGADYGPFPASTNGLGSMEYITASSTGNASNFGGLNSNYTIGLGSVSNGSRGVFASGGFRSGYRIFTNAMYYITIGTTGDASSFGSLLSPPSPTDEYWSLTAGVNNDTRGVYGGGGYFGAVNVMQYITIASTGNATDFGDLTGAYSSLGSASGGDRGVFAGGYNDDLPSGQRTRNNIDYIAISTTGNASDFGDLSSARYSIDGASNNSRAVFAGGNSTTMEYITISTTGNSSTFGTLNYSNNFGLTASSGASS